MEALHDRRVKVTKIYQNVKDSLTQNIRQSQTEDELKQLGSIIAERKNDLAKLNSLGSSQSDVESLIKELVFLKDEAENISKRCIEIAKTLPVRNACSNDYHLYCSYI